MNWLRALLALPLTVLFPGCDDSQPTFDDQTLETEVQKERENFQREMRNE